MSELTQEFVWLLLSGLLFSLVAWHRLSWGIALLLFLLPVYQIRLTIGFLPTTYLEVFLLLLVAVWIFKTSSTGWSTVLWPWRWTLLAFLLAGLLAVYVSPDGRAALGLYRAYLLEPIVFFIVAVNVLRRPHEWRLALFGLGSSVLVIALTALFQYLGLMPGVEPYISEDPKRATGVFAFPTAIGKYVAPVVAFFFGFLLGFEKKHTTQMTAPTTTQPWWHKTLFPAGVGLLGVVALVLSVSRAALIAVFVAFLLCSLFTRWRRKTLVSALALLVVLMVLPVTRNLVVDVLTGKDVSTDVRMVLWQGTLRLLADRPWFGAGLAGFPRVYEDYKEASHTEFFPNPDHLWLTIWVELGLAGLLLFVCMVWRYLREILPVVRDPQSRMRPYALGLLGAMIAILVHGFFDTPYFKNDLAIMFWVFVALAAAVNRAGQKEEFSV